MNFNINNGKNLPYVLNKVPTKNHTKVKYNTDIKQKIV